MSKTRLKAVVRVTVDIEADSVWSGNTNYEQIAKQAEEGVRGLLTQGNELALKDLPRRIHQLELVEVRVYKETKP